jgi:hypothetical protein
LAKTRELGEEAFEDSQRFAELECHSAFFCFFLFFLRICFSENCGRMLNFGCHSANVLLVFFGGFFFFEDYHRVAELECLLSKINLFKRASAHRRLKIARNRPK